MSREIIIGLKETLEALRDLPPKVQRKILRPAMNKATTPIVSSAKKRVQRQLGLLRKSLTRKTVTYKNGGALVVVIGADLNLRQEATRPGRKKPVIINPAKYLHLVEGGTRPHSLAKDDKLARSGAAEFQTILRSEKSLIRWRAQVNKIGALPQTPAAQKRRSKLIDRILNHSARMQARKEEKQTPGAKRHPGAKAFPFLQPAFDETQQKTESIFAAEVANGIEKHAKP